MLAVDNCDCVIGCIGFSRIAGTNEAFLHRFYVKASQKHQGIGTKLLYTAEHEMKKQGITISRVHLGAPKEQWFESYAFYPKHGYIEYEPRYMRKKLF
ncbi:MAG: GNAT family N-acetyltransferase [Lachnospiraceae bacterium]|nr:GNAT family N-acetyltransferase [Ruminococcus sp.]MCM1276741.1 GNAT family N-acetyltransferase [Lachnospiraceae bacterium]